MPDEIYDPMKYQFCIRFQNTTVNSAATKAVTDCNVIFSRLGYVDYTFTVWDNSNKLAYYLKLIKELIRFFGSIKRGAVVAIQYPLLSINNVFGLFIKLARLKGVRFFCIIHDLEALRNGGKDQALIAKEISNLNHFDCVIVHNPVMLNWLKDKGLKTSAVSLELFDYLSSKQIDNSLLTFDKSIAFAGNLSKSTFIYELNNIKGWQFNLYGPNYRQMVVERGNAKWLGEYSPEQIVKELTGGFGLIWDGEDVSHCDEVLGFYLQYNNPHKFSLYIAAGLPVVAPANSAIGVFIKKHQIGILVNSLHELDTVNITNEAYSTMKHNIMQLREKVITGGFFETAVRSAEAELVSQ